MGITHLVGRSVEWAVNFHVADEWPRDCEQQHSFRKLLFTLLHENDPKPDGIKPANLAVPRA